MSNFTTKVDFIRQIKNFTGLTANANNWNLTGNTINSTNFYLFLAYQFLKGFNILHSIKKLIQLLRQKNIQTKLEINSNSRNGANREIWRLEKKV